MKRKNKIKKKRSRKSIVRELDKVFSEYIRLRDKRCFTCGATSDLQCGHLFSRVAFSIRWDEFNAHAQCRSCNLKHEYNPHIYTKTFIDTYGMDKYNELFKKYNEIKKFSDVDLLELIQLYKNKLLRLKHGR